MTTKQIPDQNAFMLHVPFNLKSVDGSALSGSPDDIVIRKVVILRDGSSKDIEVIFVPSIRNSEIIFTFNDTNKPGKYTILLSGTLNGVPVVTISNDPLFEIVQWNWDYPFPGFVYGEPIVSPTVDIQAAIDSSELEDLIDEYIRKIGEAEGVISEYKTLLETVHIRLGDIERIYNNVGHDKSTDHKSVHDKLDIAILLCEYAMHQLHNDELATHSIKVNGFVFDFCGWSQEVRKYRWFCPLINDGFNIDAIYTDSESPAVGDMTYVHDETGTDEYHEVVEVLKDNSIATKKDVIDAIKNIDYKDAIGFPLQSSLMLLLIDENTDIPNLIHGENHMYIRTGRMLKNYAGEDCCELVGYVDGEFVSRLGYPAVDPDIIMYDGEDGEAPKFEDVVDSEYVQLARKSDLDGLAKEETSQKILAAVSLTAAQADEDWQNVKPI